MSAAFALALALCAAPQEPAAGPRPIDFAESVVRLPSEGAVIALRDFDGDGDDDCLVADAGGFTLRRLAASGHYPSEPDARLALPSEHLAWDLADLDGDGAVEIVAFVDAERVVAWRAPREGGFGEGEVVLEARGYLPRGVGRMRFVRDVDGDGRGDLVLPGSGEYRIHRRLPEGGYAPPLRVSFEARIRYAVGDPQRLDARFGQWVRVPWFGLRDVDGDGRLDLVSELEDRVQFHLARPELDDEPTWELDLAALRGELPEREGIDFDDLFESVAQRVAWRIGDFDGKAPNDVLIQVGSKFRLYRDAAVAGPRGTPDQLLKSSGNVLYALVRDVEGDALPELQIVRSEKLSLGRVIRWLILPGALDFDFFTYRNEGGTFSRSPTKRTRLQVGIPRLLSFVEDVEGMGDRLDSALAVPARDVCLDGDGASNDVVDIAGEELVVHRDSLRGASVPPAFVGGGLDELLETYLLEDLDRLDDGGTKTIDLGELELESYVPGTALRVATAGRAPDQRVPLVAEPGNEPSIRIRDVDRDGRSDPIVVTREEGEWVVQFLVTR